MHSNATLLFFNRNLKKVIAELNLFNFNLKLSMWDKFAF